MTIRTTETTVTFNRSFDLAELDERQPAGTYRVVIDEEEILGISFLAYRRMSTTLHTPAVAVRSARYQSFKVDQADLDAALKADSVALRAG